MRLRRRRLGLSGGLIGFAAALSLAAAWAAPVLAAGGAQHGRQLFQACAACHGKDGRGGPLGPSLVGIVGRKAGARDDFRYSPAMMRSSIVWDEATLAAYVENPQAVVKGNRMPFSGLRDPHDAADVVAYLKTLK